MNFGDEIGLVKQHNFTEFSILVIESLLDDTILNLSNQSNGRDKNCVVFYCTKSISDEIHTFLFLP